MRKRILTILVALVTVLTLAIPAPALAFPGGNPPGANQNNLVMTLGVTPSVVYRNSTVYYTISIQNLMVPAIAANAIDVIVKFAPPQANGTAGPLVLIDTILNLAPGASKSYSWDGVGADMAVPALAVTLALDPGVTVAVGASRFEATIQTDPDSLVSGDKNIPLQVISPASAVTIIPSATQVLPGGTVNLTVTETNNTVGPATPPALTDLTSPNVVLSNNPVLAPLPLTLIKTSPSFVGGDTNADNILNKAETWTWTVIGVVVNATTTFTADGDGIDYLGNHVNFNSGYTQERASTIVTVINPNTAVTITPSASQVLPGGTVNLIVTENNPSAVSLTSPNVVLSRNPLLAPLPLTLTKASPTYTSGDTNGNSILDPAETWTWTIPGVVVNATTIFTAIGDGIDPIGNHVTYPAYPNERAQTTVTVITPNTVVTIIPTPTHVVSGGTVSLTVTENNNGSVALTSPSVLVTRNPLLAPLPLTLIKTSPTFVSGDTGGDGILGVGETWTWTIPGVVVNVMTTFTAVGDGIDPIGNHITYPTYIFERAQATVNIDYPHTTATMTANVNQVPPGGGNVILTISDTNDGNVPLTSPSVALTSSPSIAPLPLNLIKTSPSFVGGDTNANSILDPAETWTWSVTIFVNQDVSFTAIGHGLDPGGVDITYPGVPSERVQTQVNIPRVPGLSTLGIWLMIGGFAAVIVLFVSRRARRSPQQS